MPATFAHPAAILPIQRLLGNRVDIAALVIGSMAPDFGYYLNRFDLATFAHTAAGSCLVCLPTGCLAYAGFRAVRLQLCYLAPRPHRDALMPLARNRFVWRTRVVIVLLLSILVGAWTHLAWDGFTHVHGWAVQQIAFIRDTRWRIGHAELPMHHILQHVSTLVGTVVLGWTYLAWLRRHSTGRTAQRDYLSDRSRWRLLFGSAALALAVALPFASAAATRFDGYLAVRVFLFRTAVYAIGSFTVLMVGTALIVDRLRAQRNSGISHSHDP